MSEIEFGVDGENVNSPCCKVPLKLAGGAQSLVSIPTFVNEKGPYDFILDTGAGTCLIEPALADRLDIVSDHIKTGLGTAGPVTVRLGMANSVRVGQSSVFDLEIGITDEVQKIASVIRAPVPGVLGFSFLSKFRLVLDYQALTLELEEDGHSPVLAETIESRVKFQLAAAQKPLILLPVWLNDRGSYQFVLDTGASTTVISCEAADKLRITRSPMPSITGGGNLGAFAGRLNSLAVGNVFATELGVAILGGLNSLSEAVGKRLDGILGYNFLQAFTVTI